MVTTERGAQTAEADIASLRMAKRLNALATAVEKIRVSSISWVYKLLKARVTGWWLARDLGIWVHAELSCCRYRQNASYWR